MRNTLIFTFTLLLSCSLVLLSCKKDPDDPTGGGSGGTTTAGEAVPADNNNFIRMQVDGSAWSADNEIQVLQAKPGATAFYNLTIFGTGQDGSNLRISMQRLDGAQIGTGNYPIEANTTYTASVQFTLDAVNYVASFETPPGEVNISQLSGTNAAGDFELKMRTFDGMDSIVVTAGSFACNNYGVVD